MLFVLDSNLPATFVRDFESCGHVAVHTSGCGLGDAEDSQIYAYAQETEAVLVTRDYDFADIRTYVPSESAGIVIVVAGSEARRDELRAILAGYLDNEHAVNLTPGRLVIVERERIRMRPAP